MNIDNALAAIRRTDPARWLVAFDFDGTLAAIVDRPEDARLDPALATLLSRLAAAVGWVAVISGRNREFLADRVSGVLALGSYGLELPPEISSTGFPDGFRPAEARNRLAAARDELEARMPTLPGSRLEVKAWGLALHYRGAGADFDSTTTHQAADEVARRHGLKVQRGRLVIELKPAETVDKGWALRRLSRDLSPSAVVFAGDDLGDRPAWEAAGDLGVPALAVGIASAELPPGALHSCNLVLDRREELVPLIEAITRAAAAGSPQP
ncbi:MAG: trehalose-phosphatase [Candidatus Dormibacteraeota bacterium]|nr:trehalose-phosphatase [Candidatus Dormibacteraeota bacterium]